MKKFFTYLFILLSFLGIGFSTAYGADTKTGKTFDSNNCKIEYVAGQTQASNIIDNLKKCADGTSGVAIGNTVQENSVNGLAVQVKKLASGFMRYAALFAVGAIVIAGIMYTTAYGDDSKLTRAKKIAIFALLGLIIALASYSLVNAVIYIIYGAIGK